MKKLLSFLWMAVIATTAWASRSFDGTEAIYFNAGAVSWWLNGNAVQRAVLDNTTSVIGTVQEGTIYAFIIPAGSYTTIRFERASSAEAGAWNKTGDITIDSEKNYVESFTEGSTTVTWSTLIVPQEGEEVSIYFVNYPQWDAPRVHLWDGNAQGTTWPGVEMTKLDEKINGYDVYQYTATFGDYTKCIFSNNGADKTANLAWSTGKYFYINAWYDRENIPQVINTYHIYAKNETDWTTFDLYAYGTPNEPFGAWPGATSPATVVIDEVSYNDYPFQVADGGTVNLTLIFHNNVGENQPGDRRIQFSVTEARDYYLTVSDDVAAIDTEIKVLSINNSLIDYNDQYAMFNSMSEAMNKDASWTKHTNLGKTLAYHYNEDPLTPNAKEVVAGVAWTHIVLQEQSGLPRTDLNAFYANVQTWVNYIRTNCPNPDAEIILPINWAYSNDAAFQTSNAEMIANFKAVADDFNLTLCPVGIAYGNYQLDYPSTIAADLYSDDRHPTPTATYLACCLEYATIFGEDPSTITWKPANVSDEMAARMRTYAQEAYEGTQRTEPQPQPQPQTAALVITDAIAHTENFNSLGTQDPSLQPVEAGKTAVAQACTLPQGWRIENNTTAARTIGSFANASETTTYIGGVSIVSNDKNGTWNFGASDDAADRAAGGITSSAGARTITLMVHLLNDANENFNTLTLSYDVEKYRNGANAAGFTVQLYTSADGVNWASAGSDFATVFDADGNTDGAAIVPITTRNVTGSLECVFPQEGELYLAWSISATTGTDLAKSMALAIDNVSITPSISTDIPTDAVILTSSATVTENFNSLSGAEVEAAARGTSQASTLPAGWKIERNLNGPRQLGSFSAASDTTMYIGGTSLASNAYNGTWNFGATGSSDRAVGGLTTGVDGGTRGINVMTRLYNNSGKDFNTIDLAYDIEKYRNGANAAGFTVQLYTSADGATWTKAGDDFKTSYAADAATAGFAEVPASTTRVSHTLTIAFPAYTSLYLAWNISVTSGTTCNEAPGYAIDNVSITPLLSPTTGVEEVESEKSKGESRKEKVESQKILRNGQLYLMYKGQMYDVRGRRVK